MESKARSVAINGIVRSISTSIIAGNNCKFLSTILEQCKHVYLAQEDASKDIESYSDQSFTKKIKDIFQHSLPRLVLSQAFINMAMCKQIKKR